MYIQFPSNKTMTINLALSLELHNNIKENSPSSVFQLHCQSSNHHNAHNVLLSTFDINMINRNHADNKNALTAVFKSLAFLEIRSRNKDVINSTWNRIYSLRFFTPCLWIFTFIYFWINLACVLAKYVCSRRPYACFFVILLLIKILLFI